MNHQHQPWIFQLLKELVMALLWFALVVAMVFAHDLVTID